MKCDAAAGFDLALQAMPTLARAAEQAGFDALWTSETKHDPFLPLVLAAGNTQRIQLGTAVAVAFARSPFAVAQTAWDLSRFSGGRFMLGLGTQVKAHIERRFGMAWEPPAPKLREYVLALRALWDCWQNGTRLNFRGESYKLTLSSPFFNPGPIDTPRIPVYTAGVGMPLCRVAGEVADGFLVHPLHTSRYLAEVIRPTIAEGARAARRSLEEISLSASVFVAGSEREREEVRAQIAFYAATPTYRPVLELHGWGAVGEQLSALAARGRWSEMAANISDEMLETVAVVVPMGAVVDALQKRYTGLVQRISLYRSYAPGTDDDAWRALVDGLHFQ
jgi:probable F420-dependent oxidoreductase